MFHLLNIKMLFKSVFMGIVMERNGIGDFQLHHLIFR